MTRCSAICCCDLPHKDKPCPERAVTTIGGHDLCWAHASAYRNPNRSKPLRFVQRGPDLENLLARSIRLAGGTP